MDVTSLLILTSMLVIGPATGIGAYAMARRLDTRKPELARAVGAIFLLGSGALGMQAISEGGGRGMALAIFVFGLLFFGAVFHPRERCASYGARVLILFSAFIWGLPLAFGAVVLALNPAGLRLMHSEIFLVFIPTFVLGVAFGPLMLLLITEMWRWAGVGRKSGKSTGARD